MQSKHVTVQINLGRIRQNVEAISQRCKTPVLAVVKANAYGAGATRVSEAIADLVEGFCVFQLHEAIEAQLHERTGKRVLAMGPPEPLDPADYRAADITPSVWNVEQATALRAAGPALCVDTGMQRFACPPEEIDAVLKAGDCREAFTHATRLKHALQLKELCGGRGVKLHAAATALLDEPRAWLDALRPGLALYSGAVRVSSPLVEARDSAGPAGYGGFIAPRHGVILAGYSHGLRAGLCRINGQQRRILEVGMQSAFVEIAPTDRTGDEVILLGDDLTEQTLASHWRCGPHEVLVNLCEAGNRSYK